MQTIQEKKETRIKEAFEFLKSKESPVVIHTQKDVAELLGVDTATMSKIFSATPKYYNAKRVAAFNAAFGGIFNEEYLLGGEGTLLANDEQVEVPKRVTPIREAFEYLKGAGLIQSEQDVADAMGVRKESVLRMLAEDGRLSNALKIAAFNVTYGSIFNEEYLLRGEGTLLKKDQPKSFYSEVTPVDEDAYFMVEYADLRASAGLLGGGDVYQLPDTNRRLLPREYENGNYLVVRVDGDSMDDGTKRSVVDGDEVLIKDVTDEIQYGLPIRKSLFVITTRDGNVLKQITEINREEEYILCHSFNERFPDYKIPFDTILQVFRVCKKVASQVTL